MAISEDLPRKARELARQYFRDDHNNCAEAVFRSILQATGQDCPAEILKMASSFGRGMGGAGCACGALVGAQMAVGKFFGRSDLSGFPPDACSRGARLMHDRFKKQNGATCCRILHKGLPFGTEEQLAACCERTVAAAELAGAVICEVAAQEKQADS